MLRTKCPSTKLAVPGRVELDCRDVLRLARSSVYPTDELVLVAREWASYVHNEDSSSRNHTDVAAANKRILN